MNEIETTSVVNLVYPLKPLVREKKYVTEHYLMKSRYVQTSTK